METFKPGWYASIEEMYDNIPYGYIYMLDYETSRYEDPDWVTWYILRDAL